MRHGFTAWMLLISLLLLTHCTLPGEEQRDDQDGARRGPEIGLDLAPKALTTNALATNALTTNGLPARLGLIGQYYPSCKAPGLPATSHVITTAVP